MFALCLFGWTVRAQSTNAAGSIQELRAQIAAHVTAARFNGALWSIKVASLDTGRVLFEHHAHRRMSPASNSKLYAAALALDHLGGDYRLHTSLFATSEPDGAGNVRGDVIIVGRGDPSWRLAPGATNFWALFDPFVSVLTNGGVRRVRGDIVADATFFHGPPHGAGWMVNDLQDYYGAGISAIALADNTVELRIAPGTEEGQPCGLELLQPHTGLKLMNHTTTLTRGGAPHLEVRRILGKGSLHVFGELPVDAESQIEDVPVPHPSTWFALALKEALERSGIRVSGEGRGVLWPEPSPVRPDTLHMGDVASPPLRDLVRAFMKRSQNMETDLVFNHVGETTRSSATPAWRTSEQLAVEALETFLRSNDLPADELHFDGGSGLSGNNLTSAALTLELLKVMASHPASNDFLNSLPVAGVDGTLLERMSGTSAEGKVCAKTGTSRWANALSGYVTSQAGERLVFSLMLNRNVPLQDRSGELELDAIAVMLAELSVRSDATP
jgi:D-alanyl-D-alanine carboxypeptidase/D-alanyl-D-alanine-endopeptidase (penicillin-binding protein 4)